MLEVLVVLTIFINSGATALLARNAILEKKGRRNGKTRVIPFGL